MRLGFSDIEIYTLERMLKEKPVSTELISSQMTQRGFRHHQQNIVALSAGDKLRHSRPLPIDP